MDGLWCGKAVATAKDVPHSGAEDYHRSQPSMKPVDHRVWVDNVPQKTGLWCAVSADGQGATFRLVFQSAEAILAGACLTGPAALFPGSIVRNLGPGCLINWRKTAGLGLSETGASTIRFQKSPTSETSAVCGRSSRLSSPINSRNRSEVTNRRSRFAASAESYSSKRR